MKKVLICGAAGFLGQYLEYRLKSEGNFVVSVVRKPPRYRPSVSDEFNVLDLTNPADFHTHFYRHEFDEVYQLAGNVGGLGHIGTGLHDADILTESVKINLHTLEAIRKTGGVGKIFFASSQCVYPDKVEVDPFQSERIAEAVSAHKESDAHFDTFAFGQEKLFAEKLYDAYARNFNFDVRIARIGNTYGPYSTYDGPRAKAPAAICRKVAQAGYGGVVDLWGDASQTRSFTYVDDVIEGIIRLMATDLDVGVGPINLASSEMVTIEHLFETVCVVAGKILAWKADWSGPTGVRGRNSDNTKIKYWLGWGPSTFLEDGLRQTYPWIKKQVENNLCR